MKTNRSHSNIRRIDQIHDLRDLAAYLDWQGWSTTIPDADETFRPTAWPPLTAAGRITTEADRLHTRLVMRDWLDDLTTDDEGAPCATMTIAPVTR